MQPYNRLQVKREITDFVDDIPLDINLVMARCPHTGRYTEWLYVFTMLDKKYYDCVDMYCLRRCHGTTMSERALKLI
jgi:hypothetical protein